jgi:DNA-binding transcriptional regulator YdaS (Cro superfamily)
VFGEDLGRLINLITLRLRLRQSAIADIVGLSQPMISQLATGARGLPQSVTAIERIKALGVLARKVDTDPQSFDTVIAEVERMHLAATGSEERSILLRSTREAAGRIALSNLDTQAAEAAAGDASRYRLAAATVFQVLTYLADREQLEHAADLLAIDAPELATVLRRAATASSKEFVSEFGDHARLLP